jgi:hypothetical protein
MVPPPGVLQVAAQVRERGGGDAMVGDDELPAFYLPTQQYTTLPVGKQPDLASVSLTSPWQGA